MLYLFGTGSYEGNMKALKIGLTNEKPETYQREGAYYLHNPLGKFLGWREGGHIEETKLHLRLEDWKTDFLDEWFYDEPEVREIFGLPWNEIDKWLYENGKLFDGGKLPRKGTDKWKILQDYKGKIN